MNRLQNNPETHYSAYFPNQITKLFFCLSRQPFFVNESLCCCCCAKVSPMYLYIEIGVPLVYYAFQLALPEGQNFQTFPLLDQWNQIQQEWDRSLIYEKKKRNGVIQEGKTIRNWRERRKERMKSQEANE